MVFQIPAAFAALLSLFLPGISLSFALLNGTKFGRFDKTIFGLILGIIMIPLLSFLEYFLFGIKINALLVLANALLVLFASLGWLYFQKHAFSLPTLSFDEKRWKSYAVMGIVTLSLLAGFYFRIATAFSPQFFEFDPYYYDKLTERLVQNGYIPLFTSDSFFPNQAFQHWSPLVHYFTGSVFLVHQFFTSQAYDQETLILISQLYPPLVGALLSFIVFALIREEFNEYLAVIPALLFAITPQLIKKLAGGVSEQQPWGFFTALLVLTLLVLALKRRSYRLAAFAGLAAVAAMLGSQQWLWPAMILAAFLGVQGILDYLAHDFEKRKTAIFGVVTGGFILGNTIMALYQDQAYLRFDTPHILFLASSFLGYLILHAFSHYLKLKTLTHRAASLAGFFVLLIFASFFVQIDDVILNTITSQAQIATTGGPLTKTIQEEARTVEALFPGSFGILNPNVMILLATLLSVFTASAYLASKRRKKLAAGVLLSGLAAIALNAQIDTVINAVSGAVSYAPLQALFSLITGSDVFVYMLITMAATAVMYLASEKKNETPLLLVFIFFPVAYIGLNKLKFIVHLSVALIVVYGYLLGESFRLFEHLNAWLKLFSDPAHLRVGALGVLLFIGAITVTLQAQTIQQSLDELAFTRIPSDWVKTYEWMRTSTPSTTRVLSWWDYGHWTTFFGQRNTVLNPSNNYPGFDQGVAQALVNGEDSDLYQLMEYHQATHVLVDAELVGKWGALVFLSGTCSASESPVCPKTAEVDWRPGPGQSKYELAHYFEQLSVTGECPSSISAIPLVMVQSGFGPIYCVGQNEYFVATQAGLNTSLRRSFKIIGRDKISLPADPNVSYWVPTGPNQFLNINPYLEPYGLKSGTLNAAFTRLFFFESFPGFKKVYGSPNGQVKVFEYVGRPR